MLRAFSFLLAYWISLPHSRMLNTGTEKVTVAVALQKCLAGWMSYWRWCCCVGGLERVTFGGIFINDLSRQRCNLCLSARERWQLTSQWHYSAKPARGITTVKDWRLQVRLGYIGERLCVTHAWFWIESLDSCLSFFLRESGLEFLETSKCNFVVACPPLLNSNSEVWSVDKAISELERIY